MNARRRRSSPERVRISDRRCSGSSHANRAGSSQRQCPVTSVPGHAGAASPALSSLSVNTKSSGGAFSPTNSSHRLARRSPGAMPACTRTSAAIGSMDAAGRTPALNARKRPLPMLFNNAAAMRLRAALRWERNNALKVLSMANLPRSRMACDATARPRFRETARRTQDVAGPRLCATHVSPYSRLVAAFSRGRKGRRKEDRERQGANGPPVRVGVNHPSRAGGHAFVVVGARLARATTLRVIAFRTLLPG